MSAITGKHDDHCGTLRHPERKCAECNKEIYRYPFLEWNSVRFCGDCCHKIKKGFTADLIHVAAIVELQKQCPGETLIAKHADSYEAEQLEKRRKVEEAGWKIYETKIKS